MERITVKVNVICPTHQQIIEYMEARHWHMIARRECNEGATYSRWQMNEQHCFIDIHESPEFPDYCLKQREAVVLLTGYDNWRDEYSLVEQLLRGGMMAQDSKVVESDTTEVYFSDTGASDDSSPPRQEGFWRGLDSNTHIP